VKRGSDMARKSSEGHHQTDARAAGRKPAPPPVTPDEGGGLRPWHVLLVGSLVATAAGVYAARGSSLANTVSVAVVIATISLVAAGIFRTVAPLSSSGIEERTETLGGRTRAALEREKMLVLRSIKEIEFDRAMRKISEADFQEMAARLRSRAASLMRQLDGTGSGYRALIERDLATRVGPASTSVSRTGDSL
jgi:hypothetical protein